MKKLSILCLFILVTSFIHSGISSADICFFGYVVKNPDDVREIYDEYGLDPNAAVLLAGTGPVFSKTVEELNARRVKLIIMLQELIYEKAPGEGMDCSDYGPGAHTTSSQGLRLRSDWKSRITTFLETQKEYLSSGNVMMLVLVDEPNNNCVPNREVDLVGAYLKSLNLGVPLAITYGLTIVSENEGANPLPAKFPSNIDLFAIYNYTVFDPLDSGNPLNAPVSWAGQWREIKQKIGSRKVVLVLNSYCATYPFSNLDWVSGCDDKSVSVYAPLAYAWRDWALNEPDVIGIVPFGWKFDRNVVNFVGVRDMPKPVLDAHRSIIDSIDCEYSPGK